MFSKPHRKRRSTSHKQSRPQKVGWIASLINLFVSMVSALTQIISSFNGTSSSSIQKHSAFGNNTDGVIVRDLVPQTHLDSHANRVVTPNSIPAHTNTPRISKTAYSGTRGYVYILTNSSMPGLVKIGMTMKSPQTRAAELSKGTGMPAPYQVVGYAYVSNRQLVEKELHTLFAARRTNAKREFFAVDVADAKAALQRLAYMYPV